jgi:hypothetical protein
MQHKSMTPVHMQPSHLQKTSAGRPLLYSLMSV